jgi:hypothetical protein
VHGRDVRLLKRSGETNLAPEPLGADRRSQVSGQRLDDDTPLQGAVASHKHARHTAARKLVLEDIRVAEGPLELGLQAIHAQCRDSD